MSNSASPLGTAPILVLLMGLLQACATRVDRFTIDRVLDRGMMVPDVAKVCEVGQSLAHPMAAVAPANKPPRRALLIAEVSAGLCYEPDAWEAELAGARIRHHFQALQSGRTAEIKDARIREQRIHTMAGARFYRSYQQLEATWGNPDEGCPNIASRDEIVYLLGLFSGINALLHDRAGGGELEVPMDLLPRIARASECLDNESWWQVPAAFQAAIWATVPGSGPDDIDPWQALEDAASKGESSGVRLARAVQVLIAANAGQTALVEQGIQAHASSLAATPSQPEWALLDEYARLVTLHQSDLIWTESEGVRTSTLGLLPGPTAGEAPAAPFGEEDPFGAEDPFGEADPFAEPDEPTPESDANPQEN